MRNRLFMAVLLAVSLAVTVHLTAGGSGGDGEGRARVAAAGCPIADVEANKALARRWHEAINERNIDALDAVLAADIVHDGATFPEAFGAAGVKRILGAALTAFPDVRFTQEDLIAEADRVAVRYRAEGTHLGEFQGIAPTGRRVAWTGINMFRIDCGRIVQSWSEVDGVGRLQQLGVIDE